LRSLFGLSVDFVAADVGIDGRDSADTRVLD
jgi:hypothetical protein